MFTEKLERRVNKNIVQPVLDSFKSSVTKQFKEIKTHLSSIRKINKVNTKKSQNNEKIVKIAKKLADKLDKKRQIIDEYQHDSIIYHNSNSLSK